jgi:hypothetical protein
MASNRQPHGDFRKLVAEVNAVLNAVITLWHGTVTVLGLAEEGD